MTELVVTPHPLTTEGRRHVRVDVPRPGETLAVFLAHNGVDIDRPGWAVTIDGAQVPPYLWARTRPQPGRLIECRRTAGKNVLRVVAILVVAYYAYALGAYAEGAWGPVAGFAVKAGVFMAGSALVNKLMPLSAAQLPQYDGATGTTYSLAGGRNRARLYEPLGLVFGRVKVVPDYAAQPYSWFEGEDQYQYVRLHAGINCGSIDALKIGTTPIGSFSDVTVTQSGFPGMTTPLPDWSSVDTIEGGTLTAPGGPGAWVERTSSLGTRRMAIDIGAQLYSTRDDGGMDQARVVIEAEYRSSPASAWYPFAGGTTSEIELLSSSAKPVRRTVLTPELPAGQYQVRMRKVTADASSTRVSNTVEWGSLKSYQVDSADYRNHPQVGIRIKASGQLSGTLDEVTWEATAAPTPVWTGSTWVTQATSNPGAWILRFARGIYDDDGRLMAGLGWPDSQIDIEGLKLFMVHCAAKGYTFDFYLDKMLSCLDMMEAMAAVGLGSIGFPTGRLGVVWVADDQPLEGVVAMANIKAGTFRVDHATLESSEELEISFFDRDAGWTPASVRIKAPGVTMPRETARRSPAGVVTQAGAVLMGRFPMAQNIYQRKGVSWEMDLEHISYRRFDCIALSHDLTRWGASGRLRAATRAPGGAVTIQLDEPVEAGTAPHRYVGLRLPQDRAYRVFEVAAFTGTAHALTLADPWPNSLPLPGSTPDDPAHDTIWIYDFKAEPGKRLLITSIAPTPNLTGAKITAVPDSPEFWDYVQNGTFTAPAAGAPAQPLVASNAQVTQERVSLTQVNGTELVITFDVSGPYDHAQVWGARQGEPLQLVGTTRTARLDGWRVGDQGTFDIEVRPFDALGRPGTIASTSHAVVVDALPPPADAGVMVATVEATGWLVRWPVATDVTVTASQLRLDGTSWDAAPVLFSGLSDRCRIPFLAAGSHLLRLRHLAGTRRSAGERTLALPISNPGEAVLEGASISLGSVEIRFGDATTSQPLKRIDFRLGDGFDTWGTAADAGAEAGDARSHVVVIPNPGTWRIFWRAVDVAGNTGPVVYDDVTTTVNDITGILDDLAGAIGRSELRAELVREIDQIAGLGDNLFPNPAFTPNGDTWDAAICLPRVAAGVPAGAPSVHVLRGSGRDFVPFTADNWRPVTPGEVIDVQGWCARTSSSPPAIGYIILPFASGDGSGAVFGGAAVLATTTDEGWHRTAQSWTVPAGVYSIRSGVWLDQAHGGPAVAYFAQPRISRRSAAVDRVAASVTQETSERTSAVGVVANSVTQLRGDFNGYASAVDFDLGVLSGQLSTQGQAITTVQSRVQRVVNYELSARGFQVSIGRPSGFYAESGPAIGYGGRSYYLMVFNGTNGAVVSGLAYDVYGAGEVQGGRDAGALIAALNALDGSVTIAVVTDDEPATNLSQALKNALKRCGATQATLDRIGINGAYILVGIPGMGEGSGMERYVPAPNAWAQLQLQLVNGRPVGMAGGAAVPQLSATVQHEISTRADETGHLGALWSVRIQLSNNGRALLGGMAIAGTSDGTAGPTISTGFATNEFWIGPPEGVGGDDVRPFYFQTTDITLPGGHVQPRGAYFDALFVGNVSAILAKFGVAWIEKAMIGDAQVDTLQVAGNAVSVPSRAFTAGALNFFAGHYDPLFATLQTLLVPCTGQPVTIFAGTVVTLYGADAGNLPVLELREDGVPVIALRVQNNSFDAPFVFPPIGRTPSPGMHTYSLIVTASALTLSELTFTQRSLVTLENKR